MSFTEKDITCKDCGTSFVFTTREQQFFADKGFTNDPSRCSDCRMKRKQESGSFSSRGNGSSGMRQLYPVKCADCGTETEVPFLPRGDKPVYCRPCFQSHRG